MFEGATEEQKSTARVLAIAWVDYQRTRTGDIVWMPDPDTGELMSMTATRDSQ